MARGGKAAEPTSGPPLSPAAILWGLVFGFVLVLGAGTVLGLVSAWSNWNSTSLLLQSVGYGATGVAGFLAARRARRLGWLHGGIVGAAFLMIGCWALLPDFRGLELVSVAGLARVLLSFIVGAVGGMIARLA